MGAAHGLSGILYLLLLARSFVPDETLNSDVKKSMDKLAELDQLSSGNFRSSVGSKSDRLVQFCHGAPGVIFLYVKAAEVFPDSAEQYVEVAKKCADVTWKAGVLKKG